MRWAALWMLLLAAVLVPYFLFEGQFNDLAAKVARGEFSGWPAAGAIGGLLALDVVLPVPSSIVATAGGALLGFWRGAAVSWIGMTAGCLIGYWIGRRASGMARRLVGAEGLDRAAKLAARYGVWALALARPVPVLAEASIVFAGMTGMPAARTLGMAALANLGIALTYAAVGAFAMPIPAVALALTRRWQRRGAGTSGP